MKCNKFILITLITMAGAIQAVDPLIEAEEIACKEKTDGDQCTYEGLTVGSSLAGYKKQVFSGSCETNANVIACTKDLTSKIVAVQPPASGQPIEPASASGFDCSSTCKVENNTCTSTSGVASDTQQCNDNCKVYPHPQQPSCIAKGTLGSPAPKAAAAKSQKFTLRGQQIPV